MATGTRGLIGKEDFSFHDPATGTAAQTFNRTTSTGGTTPITKISAQDLPLLDAVVVTGAATPFESLADTQATKTVELALKDIRKNIPHYRNVEHYGMVPNDPTSGVAQRNRLVWNEIISDISASSRGDGIFFPCGTWYVDIAAAQPILSCNLISDVTVVGSGLGSIVSAIAGTSATDVFYFTNGSNIRIADLAAVKDDNSHASIFVGSTAVAISQIRVMNVETSNGAHGVRLDGGGYHCTAAWVENCFPNADTLGVYVSDFANVNINGNLTSKSAGSIGGFRVDDGSYANGYIGGITMRDNQFTGTTDQTIAFSRTTTYDANLHQGLNISGNKVGVGNINIVGMNVVDLSKNELYDGGFYYNTSGMSSVRNFRSLFNYSNSSTISAFEWDITNCTVDDFEIVGGRYYGAQLHGIYIHAVTTSVVDGGRIYGVQVRDCSQDTTNLYNGIYATLGAGCTGSYWQVGPVFIRSTAALKHKYGIETAGAGTWANCKRWGVMTKSYGTADAAYAAGWADMAAETDIP